MSEKNECASKLKEGEIVFGVIFPAHNESSKVVQPGEETLNFPALGVPPQTAAIIEGGLGSSTTMRDQEQYLLFEHSLAQWIAVISPVGNETQRFFFHQSPLQGRFHELHFRGRSSFCVDGDRKTVSISKRHDFT